VDSGLTARVIVAGAGPAGAVAARTLAAAGVDTLLVDRSAFPRNKPCGGGLSARVLKRFPWLSGLAREIDVHTTSKLHLQSPNGSVLRMASDEPAVLLVRRLEFDQALVRKAAAAGCRIREGFEIGQVEMDDAGVTLVSRTGETLRGSMLIGADGVHSVVAKRTGLNARWPREILALDMMEETPVSTLRATDPDVLWVGYAHANLDGYAYVFPKSHHVNVGIGCLLSHYHEHDMAPPYELQEAFVRDLVSKGVLAGRSDRGCFTPFLIPVGGPLRRPYRERVLLAGDAGGFVNAFTAEGIYYAMVSGELAGRAIADARDPADACARYERSIARELRSELRDSALIQRFLFADRERVNRLVASGQRSSRIGDMLVAFAKGDVSYRTLRRRVLLRSPALAMRVLSLTMSRAS
jgi:geranylgeranyl reductase family protein